MSALRRPAFTVALVVTMVSLAVLWPQAASAKGPRWTLENGDVHYTLNWQHETSLAERSNIGAHVRYLAVPGSWAFPSANGRARGLSRDGSTLVLVQRWSPTLARRSNSRFAVIDVRRLRIARLVRLPGRLELAGISADGCRLTLVERTAGAPQRRVFDVSSGRLDP